MTKGNLISLYMNTLNELAKKREESLIWGNFVHSNMEEQIKQLRIDRETADALPNRQVIDAYLKLKFDYSSNSEARKDIEQLFDISERLSLPIIANATINGWIKIKSDFDIGTIYL